MSIISTTIRKLGHLGIYRLARFITRNEPKVLMYHRFAEFDGNGAVGVETFEKQLQYVKRHFHPVTMSELADEVYEQNHTVPNRVVITIDDGYQDFYQYAYPLLKKYDIAATLYVTTGFVDNKNWLWPDKISWLLSSVQQPRPEFRHHSIKLEGGKISQAQQADDWRMLINYLLSVDNETKDTCIAALADVWDVPLPQSAPEKYQPCTVDQLKEMQENGIELGGHTVNHPSLGKVTKEVAEYEILESEKWLNDHLGCKTRSFCYPNGTSSDFNQDTMDIVAQQSKFNAAVTAFADAHGNEQRYAIRRHAGSHNMFQFYKSITGVELTGFKLRNLRAKHG